VTAFATAAAAAAAARFLLLLLPTLLFKTRAREVTTNEFV